MKGERLECAREYSSRILERFRGLATRGNVRVVRFRDNRLLALTCLLTVSGAIDSFGETEKGLASKVVGTINRTPGDTLRVGDRHYVSRTIDFDRVR